MTLTPTTHDYIILIEDPFDRYIHQYNELHRKNDESFNFKNADQVSKFPSFPVWLSNTSDNYYTRFLAASGDRPEMEMNRTFIELAKRVLDDCSGVLLTETLQSSMEILYTRFGWNRSFDIGRVKKKILRPLIGWDVEKVKEKFHEKVMFDNELFEYARYLNRKQLEEAFYWKTQAEKLKAVA